MFTKENNFHNSSLSYEIIPKRIKHFRIMENYTQKYVADKIGISRQSYNHYESGRVMPDISILFSLSELYQIPIDCLFQQNSLPKNSFFSQLERMSAYSKDFMDFFNKKDNMIKYHSLSRKEKQLVFYFKHLSDNTQKDFLITIYITYLHKLSQNA